MVIVKLMGGMGNQMFQYAFGLYFSIKNQTELKLDLNFLQDRKEKKNFVFREFDLTIFNASENNVASNKEITYYTGVGSDETPLTIPLRLKRKIFQPTHLIDYSLKYHPEYKELKGNIYLEGYFQSPKYFTEIETQIRKEFTFRDKILPVSEKLLQEINSVNSVCLNVRRADFVEEELGKSIQGFVGIEYYLKAVKIIKEKISFPELFIFSDDIEWCQNNLHFDVPMHFVFYEHKGEKFGNYLHLMSLCKHFIIPNSTFAWWAAWLSLNNHKIVVAPQKWMADPAIDENGLIPETWIRL